MEEEVKIETVQADMRNFILRKKVDFAFIMMGSFSFKSNEELLNHLHSMAYSFKKGALYLIQNMAVDWTKNVEQSWTMERNGIKVRVTYTTRLKDILNQIYIEKIAMEVDDHGKQLKLEGEENLKFVFPQEFKALVKLDGKFEFLGWWEGTESTWHIEKPLEKAEKLTNINMALLRRK
ncbi:MAG: hypothetical protein ACPL0C_05565 [Candidatus Bathyarchaeales archaeon]